MRSSVPEPLSLYVHLPWCIRKCPYCDFNSHASAVADIPEAAYIEALLRDLRFESPDIAARPVASIFFGGGTPSLFSAHAIDRFLSEAARDLHIESGAEVTLEANPGTAEAARFRDYRLAGVNRLSLGVQSLDDSALVQLGRIHDAKQARQAVEIAQSAGFTDFNIDLMYALPGQSVAGALADLRAVIDMSPSHISWYQLTIEPNTVFHHAPPVLPGEAEVDDMSELGTQLLAEAGFHRYEISAYALTGQRSTHNLNYWTFGDYLGLGAGAHSKLTGAGMQSIRRFARHRIPRRYMDVAGSEDARVMMRQLNAEDLLMEFMLNACRLVDGFPLELFSRSTGLSPDLLKPGLERARDLGLMLECNGIMRPTDAGLRYLNDLLELFVPEPAARRRMDGAPEAA